MNFSDSVALFFNSPLRNKLALLLVVLVSTSTLVLGTSSLYLIDNAHRSDVEALESQVIGQKIEEIEKFFADTVGSIELTVAFTQTSEIALSEQEFLLNGILESNRAFEFVSFINLDGMETAKISKGGENLPLFDHSMLGYVNTAKGGNEFISSVYHTQKGPMITMVTPVYNRNGVVIQLLMAEVNLSGLAASLKGARLGEAGYLIVADSRGRVISSGSDRLLGGEDISGWFGLLSAGNAKLFNSLDYYSSFVNSAPVAGFAKSVPQYGWTIIAEWPLSDANAIIGEIRRQVLLLTLGWLVSILLLAPLLARRLTRPIEILKEGAARIEKGDFTKELSVKTNDELEDLGSAFNRMSLGLRQLEELRNEFIYVVTHELRNPITAIRGYISLLKDGSGGRLPKNAKGFVEAVWQSAENLGELVNELLDVARMEAGQFKIDISVVDPKPIFSEVIEQLSVLAQEKKIEIIQTFPTEKFFVAADPFRLKQVLTNLVSNAIKYNKEKGKIFVAYASQDNKLSFSVEDNGIGISKKDRPYIFTKYFRAKGGGKVGTGLGLYITKQLVEKMDGSIYLESTEGKGTKFVFNIPASGRKNKKHSSRVSAG